MPAPPKPSPAVITELDIERLCEAIERERCRRQLTHREVANQLGVSVSTILYWRHGTTHPTGDALLRVFIWLNLGLELHEFTRYTHADPLPESQGKAA